MSVSDVKPIKAEIYVDKQFHAAAMEQMIAPMFRHTGTDVLDGRMEMEILKA